MTPVILALNLSRCFAALSALCLSLHRLHAESSGTKPTGQRATLLRTLGWTGLSLCLLVA